MPMLVVFSGRMLAPVWMSRKRQSLTAVCHTGVAEHSARHHVLVVVVRRLVTIRSPWYGPMFIAPWSDVAIHSARSRDIVIAMP
jgi:hypothetical protein